MFDEHVRRILSARVYDVARETPLDLAHRLSARLGHEISIKREDLQPVFSFKLRGAYNKMVQLSPAQAKQGVVAASAGNHAQGVSLAAAKLGMPATIVMPRTTPQIKVDGVRKHGAKVILHGDTYDEAYERARQLEKEEGRCFVHPYDDDDVIAGQGTVAMEILRQHTGAPDAIFVPVGGGGLASGVLAYIKFVNPDIKVIGVEPEDAACMDAALKAQQRVVLDRVGIFADGTAVRQLGERPFEICCRGEHPIDGVIRVDTDEICAAVLDIFEDTRTIAEPAGALAVAGLKRYCAERDRGSKQKLVAILSGANINFHRLRHISERAELGEKREVILAVELEEVPGAFRSFCQALSDRAVTEFNYRLSDPKRAQIFVGLALEGGEAEKATLLADLEKQGYPALDLSGNDFAKIHLRHMVGGIAPDLERERVFRFQFPSAPEHWPASLARWEHGGISPSSTTAIMEPLKAEFWPASGSPSRTMRASRPSSTTLAIPISRRPRIRPTTDS